MLNIPFFNLFFYICAFALQGISCLEINLYIIEIEWMNQRKSSR